MNAFEMTMLYDCYGTMLTQKQREYIEMRYHQDLSLGEIAEMTGVSRQAVFDNLTRTETLLRRMEENIGCVKRDMQTRKAIHEILNATADLSRSADPAVLSAAQRIKEATHLLEE